ncbi:hypothetical protein Z043_122635 [Scleropages formosus]|uniref:MYND-type domain-containing protein n=1 Tax=Scleropages formosus TaxID=113540 RepID=A0A0P7UER2_SCLFO|nr:hypothetical protein Z043_122635 [Scleropages formosus]
MVEKTRRSVSVLRRCQELDRQELHYWRRRSSEQEEARKSKSQSPRGGEAGISEEAVNEVKRQAMDEVQKAVAEAEQRAFEMIAAERAKMEKTLAEAKCQAAKDAIQVISEQEDSSESCWNCGRKASETCSGCNAARYCGSFCQHKDWEKHHLICSPGLQAQPKSLSVTSGGAAVTKTQDVAGAPNLSAESVKAPAQVSAPGDVNGH